MEAKDNSQLAQCIKNFCTCNLPSQNPQLLLSFPSMFY